MKKVRALGRNIEIVDYSGKSEEWKNLKERLLTKREEREYWFQAAIKKNQQDIDEEDQMLAAIMSRDKSEYLFYQIHSSLEEGFPMNLAAIAASIIMYAKDSKKTFKGKVHKTKRINGILYNTESATLVFEDFGVPDDITGEVPISQYYVQNETCFRLSFLFSLLENTVINSKLSKPELSLADGEELIAKLEKARKLDTFKKKYPAIYAGFLMDR